MGVNGVPLLVPFTGHKIVTMKDLDTHTKGNFANNFFNPISELIKKL